MSVYQPKGSPFYQFDFQWRGRRFYGTTKQTSRREAERVERHERERAKKSEAQIKASGASVQLDHLAGRYWEEVGKHHAGADNTWRDLERLIDYFGPAKLLTEITDDDVAKLVAWRRGHRIIRNKKSKPEDCPLITNTTVNRTTTGVLKKLFTRAKVWNVRFEHEPKWKDHWLKEAGERIRELRDDEADRIEAVTREDYWPLFAFARATGLRQKECVLLRWSEVDWQGGRIVKRGKGNEIVTAPITNTVREILWPLQGHHPESVFTFVANRGRGSVRIKGQRYPITISGLKTVWRRISKAAGISDFRFHDFRHDFGTKLLRATGNLKLVQRALNHADIKTTTRYAHVLDDEVAAALERVSESRKKSRNTIKRTG
jgi:integrase